LGSVALVIAKLDSGVKPRVIAIAMLNTFNNRMENLTRIIMHSLKFGFGLNFIIIIVIINLFAVRYGGEVRVRFSSLCFGR
jgi:hypothetical protein